MSVEDNEIVRLCAVPAHDDEVALDSSALEALNSSPTPLEYIRIVDVRSQREYLPHVLFAPQGRWSGNRLEVRTQLGYPQPDFSVGQFKVMFCCPPSRTLHTTAGDIVVPSPDGGLVITRGKAYILPQSQSV